MNEPLLQPYLSFNGNCEEAMNFYQSVLGGELEFNRFKDYENPQMPVEADMKDKIMHSTLKNEGMTFMASDAMKERAAKVGDNITISLAGTDEAKLTKFFNGLSAGGKVTMPLAKQIWGDTFGMFVDKYGINWMVNIGSGGQEVAKA